MSTRPASVPPRPPAPDDLPSKLEKMQKALKVMELAKILGVGRTAMYEHVRRGVFPTFRVRGEIRIDSVVVAQWLRDHTLEARGGWVYRRSPLKGRIEPRGAVINPRPEVARLQPAQRRASGVLDTPPIEKGSK